MSTNDRNVVRIPARLGDGAGARPSGILSPRSAPDPVTLARMVNEFFAAARGRWACASAATAALPTTRHFSSPPARSAVPPDSIAAVRRASSGSRECRSLPLHPATLPVQAIHLLPQPLRISTPPLNSCERSRSHFCRMRDPFWRSRSVGASTRGARPFARIDSNGNNRGLPFVFGGRRCRRIR